MESSESSNMILRTISNLETYISKTADRRTDDYPLINSLCFQIATSIIYLFIVMWAGPKFMANRKPFKLKTTIRLYNVFQILACVGIIYWSTRNAWSFQKALFTTCYPVNRDASDQTARNILNVFYFTYFVKLAELIETIFFVLRKKYSQVSSLHLYHHVSTLFIVWWAARYYPGGLALFPILLNSFVHILMYIYYLIANFGPKYQKLVAPIKPYITIIQMAQFTLLILMSFNLLSPYYCKEGPQTLGYFFFANVILVFYLFFQFFKRTYLKSDHPSKLTSRKSNNKPTTKIN